MPCNTQALAVENPEYAPLSLVPQPLTDHFLQGPSWNDVLPREMQVTPGEAATGPKKQEQGGQRRPDLQNKLEPSSTQSKVSD